MLSVILFVLPPLPSPIPKRKRTEHELHTANHSIDKIDVADLKGCYHIRRKDVGEVGAEQHEVVRDGDGQGFAVWGEVVLSNVDSGAQGEHAWQGEQEMAGKGWVR